MLLKMDAACIMRPSMSQTRENLNSAAPLDAGLGSVEAAIDRGLPSPLLLG